MNRYLEPLVVFLVALVVLGIGIERAKVAAPISDPVGGYRSQDESLFANSAMTMAVEGGWLTPRFLGRIYLQKPPVQLWLSALSMKLLGISLWALRLPMLIASALGVVLLFAGCRESASAAAGLVAALLLVSDPLWHIFSRLCYTDLLLTVFCSVALWFVFRDPRLERSRSILGFAMATAAAIMTKNVAGAIPILTLLVYSAAMRSTNRPRFLWIVTACGLAILLAAPWHLYQLMVHFHWFWADYVQTQLLAYGVHPPAQISADYALLFYAKRLFLVDPVLCILALASLPGLWMAAKRRDSAQPILIGAWLVVVLLALCSFQARGQLRWVLFLVPPLCMLAACFAPFPKKWVIAILGMAFVAKAGLPARTWGLPFGAYPPMPAEARLRAYSDRARPNPLVLINSDDELYSATLPIHKIHYCWIDANGLVQRLAPHYVELGITVTASQFAEMARLEPGFRDRLRAWGLDSAAPLATAIVAESDADIARMIATHPAVDFYLPPRFRAALAGLATHDIDGESSDYFFLLARQRPETPPAAKFKLPDNW